MLIYGKVVSGVTKLFGTMKDVPADSDNELVYKDFDGDIITIDLTDTFVDGKSSDNIQRVKRLSDEKAITVYIKNSDGTLTKVIGDDPVTPKVVKSIKLSGPTKKTYAAGESLDLTGLVVKEVYADGDEITITSGYTVSPAAGTAINADTTVTVTHAATSKTATFKVKVSA